MSTKEIVRAIGKLSGRSRTRVIQTALNKELEKQARLIEQKFEDHLDVQRHLAILKKGEFVPWEEVKKKLDAKFHRSRKTSRKVS